MTEKRFQLITVAVPIAEAADLAVRAARAGVWAPYFNGLHLLTAAYGFMHPEVAAHRNRASNGISGPKTLEELES